MADGLFGDQSKNLLASIGSMPELKSRMKWLATARHEQLPPKGLWPIWLILAGRGFGKTRAGSEWSKWGGMSQPNSRIAVVGPNISDVRLTCFEGISGLTNVLPNGIIKNYNKSSQDLHIELHNGTIYRGFSSERPDKLRGPEHHHAWCDELSSWKYDDTWDMLNFGLRLGVNPQICVTTTPKPNKLTRQIIAENGVQITRGSTFDNRENLSAKFLEQLVNKYEGTRLGEQELYAKLLDDVVGALWTAGMIETAQSKPMSLGYKRIVVGVDPSGSDGETGDSQGIIVAGQRSDDEEKFDVLADRSLRGSPDEWGKAAVKAYTDYDADKIVAERNFGGEMVRHVIQSQKANVPVEVVTASRGKHIRAEPIAALYEQSKVGHAKGLSELESEMTAMTTQGYYSDGSPDRVDALVWALTELSQKIPAEVTAHRAW